MDDRTDRPDENADEALPEIMELRVEPHPDLEGRILRDINRRTLAADSLDFSLVVMMQTFWDHLRSLIEAWPASHRGDKDSKN